jgi:hypothetical protein
MQSAILGAPGLREATSGPDDLLLQGNFLWQER